MPILKTPGTLITTSSPVGRPVPLTVNDAGSAVSVNTELPFASNAPLVAMMVELPVIVVPVSPPSVLERLIIVLMADVTFGTLPRIMPATVPPVDVCAAPA